MTWLVGPLFLWNFHRGRAAERPWPFCLLDFLGFGGNQRLKPGGVGWHLRWGKCLGRRCWHAKKIGPSLCNDVMFWTMVSWACNGKDFVLFSLGSFMEIRNIFLQHIYVSSWDKNVTKLHMCNMLKCSCRLSLGSSGMLHFFWVCWQIRYTLGCMNPCNWDSRKPQAGYQPCRRFTAGWRCENPMRPRGLMMIPFFLPAKNFQSSTMVIMIDHKVSYIILLRACRQHDSWTHLCMICFQCIIAIVIHVSIVYPHFITVCFHLFQSKLFEVVGRLLVDTHPEVKHSPWTMVVFQSTFGKTYF